MFSAQSTSLGCRNKKNAAGNAGRARGPAPGAASGSDMTPRRGQVHGPGLALELAEDHTIALLERVRFLATFASYLDESFMVRISGGARADGGRAARGERQRDTG
jgi:Polyphosphate kinase N-terminal domain